MLTADSILSLLFKMVNSVKENSYSCPILLFDEPPTSLQASDSNLNTSVSLPKLLSNTLNLKKEEVQLQNNFQLPITIICKIIFLGFVHRLNYK
jgi:hypothetical protein